MYDEVSLEVMLLGIDSSEQEEGFGGAVQGPESACQAFLFERNLLIGVRGFKTADVTLP